MYIMILKTFKIHKIHNQRHWVFRLRGKILFVKDKSSPLKTLAYRMLFILVLLIIIACVFWLDRDGLEDTRDAEVDGVDVIYFTAITITTTGYGDIHPNSSSTMLFDSFVATPLRAIIWIVFIGTAYQLVFQQYMEERYMKKIQKGLEDHVIIAGYGNTGRAVAKELVAKKYDKDQILIIDPSEQAVDEAVEDDFIGFLGDPSKESMLGKASITKAKYIVIATSRDDTNVLISLTARDMNKNIKIIARANQDENTKLLKRSGADIIISPSVAGGHLMAAAMHQEHLAMLLQDMLTAERGLRFAERAVLEHEVGKKPKEITKIVVIGVYRAGSLLDIQEMDTTKMKSDDRLIFLEKTS
jgi:voltage-gated potassium channel